MKTLRGDQAIASFLLFSLNQSSLINLFKNSGQKQSEYLYSRRESLNQIRGGQVSAMQFEKEAKEIRWISGLALLMSGFFTIAVCM